MRLFVVYSVLRFNNTRVNPRSVVSVDVHLVYQTNFITQVNYMLQHVVTRCHRTWLDTLNLLTTPFLQRWFNYIKDVGLWKVMPFHVIAFLLFAWHGYVIQVYFKQIVELLRYNFYKEAKRKYSYNCYKKVKTAFRNIRRAFTRTLLIFEDIFNQCLPAVMTYGIEDCTNSKI